jgi:predicted RNA-binding protein with PIN domain
MKQNIMVELTKEGKLAKDTIEKFMGGQSRYRKLHEIIMASAEPEKAFNVIGEGCKSTIDIVMKIER